MKILIVDDDEIARFIIKKNLIFGGIDDDIELVENGKEALSSIIRNGSPQIILLDLNMPVMNGFQMLEYMHENNLEIDTFIITSSTLDSDRSRCMSFPFVKGFIEKPFGVEEVNQIKEIIK